MSRDSIHVTMTAQLRQAQIRQRLEALAANTALPSAHLAGRALVIGLGYIEHDNRLIFPSASTTELLTTPAPAVTAHTAAAATELLTTPAPTDTRHTAAAAAAEQATPQEPMVQAESTPLADRPLRIPSQAAARALKKTLPAFQAHLHRHPELKRHSEMVGRSAMWDLAGLRAEWTK